MFIYNRLHLISQSDKKDYVLKHKENIKVIKFFHLICDYEVVDKRDQAK